MRRVVAAAILAGVLGGGGAAQARGADLRDFVGRIADLVSDAVRARRPVPPVPVEVRFAERRIFTADLGAPLLALAAGSLDGDARAEIVALTAAEVIVLRVDSQGRAAVIARQPLGGAPPSLRPRDPVGALELRRPAAGVGAVEIFARSSDRSDGLVLALEADRLVEHRRFAGFPMCGGRAELVPGKNHFARDRIQWDGADALDLPAELAAAACFDGLVDPHGHPLRIHGAVELDGRLRLGCARREGACEGVAAGVVDGVGYAFAVIDLDRDGRPEVALSLASAPGDPDEVRVIGARGRSAATPLDTQRFQGGVVGLAAADVDGDGTSELVAAERSAGSTEVTLWTLN